MNRTEWRMAVVLAILSAGGPIFAAPPASPLLPDTSITTGQQTQQHARAMARELVAGVLDVQLRKLQINGLQSWPLYTEIASMRKDLDTLVDHDMAQVVDMLAAAESLPLAQRDQAYTAIRDKTRAIVIRLSVERQALLRRLRMAELAEQVRRVMRMQRTVRDHTQQLSPEQADRILATLQDQRDVEAMTTQLTGLLHEVSRWGGADGAAAADGLDILRTAHTDGEMHTIVASLSAARLPDAASGQQRVLQTFTQILQKIEVAQGLMKSRNDDLVKQIDDAIQQQQQLRDKTRSADLNDKSSEELLKSQSDLLKSVQKLGEMAPRTPATSPLLDRAKAAAMEATAQLFAASKDKALDQQAKVVGNLEALKHQLQSHDAADPDRSARELADQVQSLQHAQDQLEHAKDAQEQAARAADRHDAAEAQRQLAQAADQTAKTAADPNLPAVPRSRVKQAADAAQRAQNQPADAEANREAQAALDKAHSEVSAALADAQRRALAVKIGELGRAAEALERAAAAESRIARQAAAAAKNAGLKPDQAKALDHQQNEVSDIAANTAQGLQPLAPDAAQTLAQAQQPIQSAAGALEAPKQTPQSAAAAAQEANHAAEQLTQAARQSREELARTAQQLADVAGRQADQLARAGEKLDRAAAPPRLADKAPQLAQLAHDVAPLAPDAGAALEDAADRATKANADAPQQVERQVERAAADVAARHDAAQRDQRAAQQLQQLAHDQQQARDQIGKLGPQLAADRPKQQSTAQQLAQQAQDFAHQQRQIGQAAQQVAQQQPITNPPLKKALKIAAKLADELTARPEAPSQTAPPDDTGIVPQQPQLTAKLLAGDAADQLADADAATGDEPNGQPPGTLAQASPNTSGQQPGKTGRGPAQDPSQSSPDATGGGNGRTNASEKNRASTDRDALHEQQQKTGAADAVAGDDHDSSAKAGRVGGDPWVLKLPPELRQAILSNSQRPAPKGYEELLGRYFKNAE